MYEIYLVITLTVLLFLSNLFFWKITPVMNNVRVVTKKKTTDRHTSRSVLLAVVGRMQIFEQQEDCAKSVYALVTSRPKW